MTEGYNPFNADPITPTLTDIVVPIYPHIKAWSYSTVNQFNKCPLSVRYQKIDRLPQPDNQAQGRGKKIHDELAHMVRTGEFPEGITPNREEWKRRLWFLYEEGADAELQLAFTREWKQVPWFGANVWCRVVIDAVIVIGDTASVHEHKTGKWYPEHEKQERLYALAMLKLHPEINLVLVQCNYIDDVERATTITRFTRAQEKSLEQEFADFAQPLLAETIYPAAPGTHCKWCHYRKSNAGVCAFG